MGQRSSETFSILEGVVMGNDLLGAIVAGHMMAGGGNHAPSSVGVPVHIADRLADERDRALQEAAAASKLAEAVSEELRDWRIYANRLNLHMLNCA